MGFEDDYNPSGTVTRVNRYILGARGIDRVARTESGNTTLAYPMYDGHGNMRALLTRNGTGYSTGNWKTYDVWGFVRSGGSSGDPKQGYVASIGHVSDAESSLIYMRARYYEPATGRFLSQDKALDGINWFTYCGNEPVTCNDYSGKSKSARPGINWEFIRWFANIMLMHVGGGVLLLAGMAVAEGGKKAQLGWAIAGIFALVMHGIGPNPQWMNFILDAIPASYHLALAAIEAGAEEGARKSGLARNAVYFYTGYSLLLMGALFVGMFHDSMSQVP